MHSSSYHVLLADRSQRNYSTPLNRCPVVVFGSLSILPPPERTCFSAWMSLPVACAVCSASSNVASIMNRLTPASISSSKAPIASNLTLLYRCERPSASVTTGNSYHLRSRSVCGFLRLAQFVQSCEQGASLISRQCSVTISSCAPNTVIPKSISPFEVTSLI